jgi:hypothetical protein
MLSGRSTRRKMQPRAILLGVWWLFIEVGYNEVRGSYIVHKHSNGTIEIHAMHQRYIHAMPHDGMNGKVITWDTGQV